MPKQKKKKATTGVKLPKLKRHDRKRPMAERSGKYKRY